MFLQGGCKNWEISRHTTEFVHDALADLGGGGEALEATRSFREKMVK